MRHAHAKILLAAALFGLWSWSCSGSVEPQTQPAAEVNGDGGSELATRRSPADDERLAADTRRELEAVDRLLAAAGDAADPETAGLVRNLAERARAALADDDLDLARNLARKARTLAEDL